MSDSEEEVNAEKLLKLVLVGNPGSGKTSIVRRYCHQEFSRHYFPTVGVDFFLKRITVHGSNDATLQLWDVGGSALSGNMLDKYVFGAHMIIYVFDVTNASSMDSILKWMDIIQSSTASMGKPPLAALVGNKCDMEHQRIVHADRQQKFASDHGLLSFSVSARTGENVPLFFQKMAAELLGLKLSRAEQEEHQPVVRAEISDAHVYPTEGTSSRHSQSCSPRSTVCILQ